MDEGCLLITSVEHIERSLMCFENEGYKLYWYIVKLYEKPSHFSLCSLYPSWKVIVKCRGCLMNGLGRWFTT